ncbi:MAG: hypothetical protein ACT4PM_14260 [Gemmatimonadales bacterium]
MGLTGGTDRRWRRYPPGRGGASVRYFHGAGDHYDEASGKTVIEPTTDELS